MKKKWLSATLALVMAGTLMFGAGCTDSHTPTVSIGEDGYVYLDGEKTDVKASDPHTPTVSIGEDGYVYLDGEKTDVKASDPHTPTVSIGEDGYVYLDGEKTDVKAADPHTPTVSIGEDGYVYLDGERTDVRIPTAEPPAEEKMTEYNIIENGVFRGTVAAGSAETKNGALSLKNASLELAESVVLPISEDAAWEVTVDGVLLTGSATGAQFFAGSPFSEFGRVYFGVNKTSRMVYIGVRMNTVYINCGWQFSDASLFGAKHSYTFAYRDGVYTLTVDGEEKGPMSDINFNQANGSWLEDPVADAETLNTLMRTVLAQDYIEMTSIGVNEFLCNAEITALTVKTTPADGYRRLLSHPLANTKIFYLGSSITYGAASGGTAFGEIINKITGNPFQKEAVSGTTLVDNGSDSYVQRLKKFDFSQNPDYLVVQLSTNDFSTGKPLGTVQSGTASSGFDTSTVSGAIQHIIAYAKEQCPTVKVVFYVGAVRANWGYKSAYESYAGGDFKTICEKWNIEPLDILHTSYQSYACFFSDDIHPTIEGYSAGWTPLFVKYFMDRL